MNISIYLDSRNLASILKTYQSVDSFGTSTIEIPSEYVEKHYNPCQKELKIIDKLYKSIKIYGYKNSEEVIKLNLNSLKRAIVLHLNQSYNLKINNKDIVYYLSVKNNPEMSDKLKHINACNKIRGDIIAKIYKPEKTNKKENKGGTLNVF